MVGEASRCNAADVFREDGRLFRRKGFQIPIARCWSSAPNIEVLGNDFINQSGISSKLRLHFIVGVLESR